MSTKSKVLFSYGILLALYAVGTIFIPPPAGTLSQYHITLAQLRIVDSTIILLYAGIWWCALYGFYTLHDYLELIRKNKDGKALSKLTIGIGLLAYWLPISSNFSLYTNWYIEKHPEHTAAVGLLQNYMMLAIPLAAFIFICIGARQLGDLTNSRITLTEINVMLISLIVIGTTYAHLIVSTDNRLNSAYHMKPLAMLITLAVPYIYMWGIGLMAVYEIHHYRTKVPGVVYRKSWRTLAMGVGSIIFVSIVLQFLVTISQKLTRLSFSWILMLVYVLLIMLAVSYILIAIGVRTLKKIEEV
jgi:hypothetical protein